MREAEVGKAEQAINIAVALPGVNSLWSETLGEAGICVAVLDGPVTLSQPCFSGANITTVETFAVPALVNKGPAAEHGTYIASIIFGQHHSDLPGIAPGCRGLVMPIFSDGPQDSSIAASQLDLARAITQAVAEGAHIINVSGGQQAAGGEPEHHLAQAIRLCAENNVLVIAAAGNDGCKCLHVPAAAPTVLAVGAMDAMGSPLKLNNWGGTYQTQGILAPGEHISGALPTGGMIHKTGTSCAAAIVSGVSALLLSMQLRQGTKPDPHGVKAALLKSAIGCEAEGLSDPSHCERLLAGRINIPGAQELLSLKRTTRSSLNMEGAMVASDQVMPPPEISVSTGAPRGMAPGAVSTEPALPVTGGLGQMSSENNVLQTSVAPASEVGAATAAAAEAAIRSGSPVGGQAVAASEGASAPGCGCACGAGTGPPPLVYALGALATDFGSEARRDSFIQMGMANPHDPSQLVAHFDANVAHSSSVIWTLNQDQTPIYAIQPMGAFAAQVYERLREFVKAQLTEGVERVSVPGFIAGGVSLLNGQMVPAIVPELRGMYSWSTRRLVEAAAGPRPRSEEQRAEYQQKVADIENFLERVYHELRNLGIAPQERAMNYAATNASQAESVFRDAIQAGLKLDGIAVQRSPIGRPGSDCWDVNLSFFNPSRRLEQARRVYRFTVDVSDVIPVTVGRLRHWDVY